MSRVLSEKGTVEKSVVVNRTIYKTEYIKCDICGKLIPAVAPTEKERMYFEVTTGHRLWGNDSSESISFKDICPECIVGFVSDYLKDAENTYYLDLETTYAWPEPETVTEEVHD